MQSSPIAPAFPAVSANAGSAWRALEQERHGGHEGQRVEVAGLVLRQAERPDRNDLLAAHAQRRLAGHKHTAERGHGGKLGHRRRRVEDVLEVVEDQQHPPIAGELTQANRGRHALLGEAERAGDSGRHTGRVGEALEPDEEHAVGEVLEHGVSGGQRQPRLARPARTGQGQGARVARLARAGERLEVALAADQRVGGRRQVRAHDLQGARWRKAIGGHAVDDQVKHSPRLGEVLQAVLAQVLDRGVDQLPRGGANEHLPAVTRRGQAGSVVHVDAPVIVVADLRRAGVQPHPDAHRRTGRPVVLRQGALGRRDGGHGVGGTREGDEERVALGVHLDPAVRRPHRA